MSSSLRRALLIPPAMPPLRAGRPDSHAQAALARICCQHTVMIGHALNNDLEALKVRGASPSKLDVDNS